MKSTTRSRHPLRVLVAVTGLVGPLLLFFGPGGLRWLGAALLLIACVVAFADGYKNWSGA